MNFLYKKNVCNRLNSSKVRNEMSGIDVPVFVLRKNIMNHGQSKVGRRKTTTLTSINTSLLTLH